MVRAMPPPSRDLNPAERLDWLRLIRSEHVGPITFYQLLARFGSAEAALRALPEIARRASRGTAPKIYPRAEAERELANLREFGAKLVAWGEPDYPASLAAVEDAPPLIAVKGRTELLAKPMLAIVGARNASANGRRFAHEIAEQAGRFGFVVVSGLARGIDAAAHQGALDTGTLAVVAGGIDVVYPEENRPLYDTLFERGVIAAELPIGTEPKARHFPRRNRIISGCAAGVLVVEAALRSGSLITARFALEQGREVFAVPGSPLDPRCRGTNDLIRHGATLTETIDDILGILQATLSRPRNDTPRTQFIDVDSMGLSGVPEADLNHSRVLEALSPSPVPVDELVRQCQLSPAVVVTVLLELELAGRLERHPGNLVALV